MAIDSLDVNYVHRITLNCDEKEPKTVFLVRTLTMTQRARIAQLSSLINKALEDDELYQALNIALEAWECLVVGVSMFDGQVPTKQGLFGVCVPGSWFDSNIGNPKVLFELVLNGMKANMLSVAEKKTSEEGSGLPTLSNGDVENAGKTEKPSSLDVIATVQ